MKTATVNIHVKAEGCKAFWRIYEGDKSICNGVHLVTDRHSVINSVRDAELSAIMRAISDASIRGYKNMVITYELHSIKVALNCHIDETCGNLKLAKQWLAKADAKFNIEYKQGKFPSMTLLSDEEMNAIKLRMSNVKVRA